MDATDALAVAVCHHYQGKYELLSGEAQQKIPAGRKKKASWETFISANPGRVK